jgi:hypothetical protein
MLTTNMLAPIEMSASGTPQGGPFVWAGAQNSGDVGTLGNTCANWSGAQNGFASAAGSVRNPFSAAPGWFGSFGSLPCSTAYRVYCFEE